MRVAPFKLQTGVFSDAFANGTAVHIYQVPNTATGGTDTTPPTGSITAPTSGATVSGTTTVSSTDASDTDSGVAGVQFKLDGANLQSQDTSPPYSISWDTTGATNGPHTLSAVITDNFGNTFTTPGVSVTVSNTSPADLIVTGISWSPTTPHPGDGVTFSATIKTKVAQLLLMVLFTVYYSVLVARQYPGATPIPALSLQAPALR